jgi:hypothetical protein
MNPSEQQQWQQQEVQEEEDEFEAPNSYCCYITCILISVAAFGFFLSFIVRSSSLLFNYFIIVNCV